MFHRFVTLTPLGTLGAGPAGALTSSSGSGRVSRLEVRIFPGTSFTEDEDTTSDVGSFSPGDEIIGRVTVHVAGGPVRFRSLAVTLSGVAKAGWSDPGGCNAEREFFSINQ